MLQYPSPFLNNNNNYYVKVQKCATTILDNLHVMYKSYSSFLNMKSQSICFKPMAIMSICLLLQNTGDNLSL